MHWVNVLLKKNGCSSQSKQQKQLRRHNSMVESYNTTTTVSSPSSSSSPSPSSCSSLMKVRRSPSLFGTSSSSWSSRSSPSPSPSSSSPSSPAKNLSNKRRARLGKRNASFTEGESHSDEESRQSMAARWRVENLQNGAPSEDDWWVQTPQSPPHSHSLEEGNDGSEQQQQQQQEYNRGGYSLEEVDGVRGEDSMTAFECSEIDNEGVETIVIPSNLPYTPTRNYSLTRGNTDHGYPPITPNNTLTTKQFRNCGLENWQRARQEWTKQSVTMVPSRLAPPSSTKPMVKLLTRGSTVRAYDLPRPMNLADIIAVYSEVWEKGGT